MTLEERQAVGVVTLFRPKLCLSEGYPEVFVSKSIGRTVRLTVFHGKTMRTAITCVMYKRTDALEVSRDS